MIENEDKNKSHVLAVIVGLVMIMAIGFFVFAKNYKAGSDQKKAQEQASDDLKKATKITADDLQSKINKNEILAIVDIRTSQEFELEHIKNSKNISLGDFQNLWTSLDKNKTYIIVDDGQAMEGATVVSEMAKNGFKNSYYLGGGYIAWKNKNKPTISGGNPLSAADHAKVAYVSVDDVNGWLSNEEDKKDLLLIDLRDASSFAGGHLEGAINIPLDDLEKRTKEISSFKDIVAYGDTDLFGFRGAVKLFDLGYFNVSALSGGTEEWKKKNFNLVK